MATPPAPREDRAVTPLEAIADPVRLKIVRVLSERGPSTLQELASSTGVHFNTVRQHLRDLEKALFVLHAEEVPRGGRGRPRRSYRLRDGWAVPTSDFRLLAEILAGFLLKSKCKPEELHGFGANWGTYLAGRPGRHEVPQELVRMLEQLGCAARLDGSRVILSACPCPLIAPENPPLICHLIVAVSRGFLGASSSEIVLKESAHDPARRSCALKLGKRAV
jgi:predicted ArsR family transcriptional regulator